MTREQQVDEIMAMMDRLPLDSNHALVIGNVMGALLELEARLDGIIPTKVYPEKLDGDYTSRLIIERPSGKYAVTVERLESYANE